MSEAIYFAGGFYRNPGSEKAEFAMVHTKGSDIPYLTKNRNGLRLTAHHANLYRLTDDMKEAVAVDIRCPIVGAEWHRIRLSEKQQELVRAAIERNYFFS